MYVDESGDSGLIGSPTRYFALSGITVHESRWRDLLDHLVAFRRTMKAVYGLPLKAEIHASEYIRHPPVPNIQKHQRLAILRNYLDELAKLDYIRVTNVVVDKNGKSTPYDVFDTAWRTLFQRFENTVKFGNFPGHFKSDKGMVIVDNTEGGKLQRIVRKMAVYNPIPSLTGGPARNIPTVRLIEDPHHRDSQYSYLIQSCDVCAYFLQQKHAPSSYIRKSGAAHYFNRLQPILNTSASRTNGLGIVLL